MQNQQQHQQQLQRLILNSKNESKHMATNTIVIILLLLLLFAAAFKRIRIKWMANTQTKKSWTKKIIMDYYDVHGNDVDKLYENQKDSGK